MKLDEALLTLTHFFNDIIGALIPGLVLVTGIVIIHNGIVTEIVFKSLPANAFLMVLACAILFGTGHGLLAVQTEVRKVLIYANVYKGDAVVENFEKQRTFMLFKSIISEKLGNLKLAEANLGVPNWGFNDLRNVALSISNEGAILGRRFMFISLLCNGVGTAILLLAVDFFICDTFYSDVLAKYPFILPPFFQILLLVTIGVLYLRRGAEFYRRAMVTPFSVALTELLLKETVDEKNN